MNDPLMDKYAVASYIGGITPRVARELMRTMPCINVAAGVNKPKLRVYQSDLEAWLQEQKKVHVRTKEVHRQKHVVSSMEGLDETGHILRRKARGA